MHEGTITKRVISIVNLKFVSSKKCIAEIGAQVGTTFFVIQKSDNDIPKWE